MISCFILFSSWFNSITRSHLSLVISRSFLGTGLCLGNNADMEKPTRITYPCQRLFRAKSLEYKKLSLHLLNI